LALARRIRQEHLIDPERTGPWALAGQSRRGARGAQPPPAAPEPVVEKTRVGKLPVDRVYRPVWSGRYLPDSQAKLGAP